MIVLLTGATLDSQNMGVRALTAGTIKCILNQCPEATVELLDYSKAPSANVLRLKECTISVPLIDLRFSWRLYLANNVGLLLVFAMLAKLIPSQQFRCDLLSRNRYLHRILEADLAVSLAGGDSFSDIYGIARLLYVSLPQILILLLDKPLTLFPQTIGPFKSVYARALARFILGNAQRVYSRDRQGESEITRLLDGRRVNVEASSTTGVSFDVGFAVDSIPPPNVEIEGLPPEDLYAGRLIGLNVSGLLLMGGYNRKNMFGLMADYREIVLAVLDLLIRGKDAKVVLVPHVFGSEPESDSLACADVFDSVRQGYDGRIGIIRGSYDQSGIKHIIGHCDFFVGSRMHACIAALSQGIPTVSIAYSKKFAGVMETIGSEDLVADARHMQVEQIRVLIDDVYERRRTVRKRLNEEMAIVRSSQRSLLQHVPKSKGEATDEGTPTLAERMIRTAKDD